LCPFLDEDEIIDHEEEQKDKDLAKYDIFKRNNEDENKRKYSIPGKFVFDYCPASYTKTDKSLINLISLVNWSEDMKTPLVGGGLLNHTNWFFEARNVIINEQRLIEKEELDKNKNIKSGSHPKTSRKPKLSHR